MITIQICGAARLDSSATFSPTRGKGVGYASRRITRWVSDNNKVGVFADAKDFSALLKMTVIYLCDDRIVL
jgi:hypothetical protein